ncbi:MAG TPA: hypothetical protein PLQ97_12240 [Myxococcota bacterium]|nr:hypothetical protein [Myxococcota bacterium]HQK51873.1 hypothetical protein [Myxococcota bacterium]
MAYPSLAPWPSATTVTTSIQSSKATTTRNGSPSTEAPSKQYDQSRYWSS